jgi:hypothetical protein
VKGELQRFFHSGRKKRIGAEHVGVAHNEAEIKMYLILGTKIKKNLSFENMEKKLLVTKTVKAGDCSLYMGTIY